MIRLLSILVVLTTSLLAAFAGGAQTLTNGDFESAEPVGGALPIVVGDWDGDLATIVGAEGGVTPLSGSGMLRFDATFFTGASFDTGSEVYQLVDVSSLSGPIANSLVTATFGASFNRVAASSDSLFRIQMRAHSGSPSDFDANFPDLIPHLQLVTGIVSSDPFPATWQTGSVEMLLPAGTTYLAVTVLAEENSVNNSIAPEFAGHYADSASLSLVTASAAPGLTGWSLLLLVVSLCALAACQFAQRRAERKRC